MTMFTKHVIKQLSAYCNEELAPDQAKRVREHLLECERCRNEHDEIRLGVSLAQQLPLVSAPAEMWSEIESLLDERSRRPVFEQKTPKLAFAFTWYRVAAVTAVLLLAVLIAWMVFMRPGPQVPKVAWEVEGRGNAVRIDGDKISGKGRLAVGETLNIGDFSGAKVTVSDIGEVELDPNSQIRLLQTKPDEHRIALDHGLMKATISAPPRLFFVNTLAAEAIDLGCVYTLEVDGLGRSLLHVTLGEVELVRNERGVYVPRFAMCQARPEIGPGTPYFEDASETFVRLLESFDFENGGDAALTLLLGEARQRDTFTLWHLLSTVDGERRARVLDRMISLVGLPKGVSRGAVLRLDQTTLEAWKVEMVDTVWF
jgi:hypothetical protein